MLEINVAIITGCLPLMKPLFQGFLGRMRSGATKRSQPSSGRYYPSSGTPDGLNKFFDPRNPEHFSTIKADEAAREHEQEQEEMRHSSDVELHGIAVTTAVDQDVDSRSDVGNIEAVSNRNWPL